MTINQCPMEGATAGYFQWPVLQRLRHVCDQLGTYRDVVTGLQEYQTMTSFFAHVIGTKPTQHTVITSWRDSKGGWAAAGTQRLTNHLPSGRHVSSR